MSDIIQLAALATAILAPHLPTLSGFIAVATGKKVVDKGIDGAFNAAKSLWEAISASVRNNQKAVRAAEDLASDPDDPIHRSTFASRLADVLAVNPELQAEIENLLESPLTQSIVADGATVRDAQQIASALVKSRQEIIAFSGAVVERVVQKVTDGRPNA